jgi:hypothetical protein
MMIAEGQECTVCPLDNVPLEKRAALFAARMVMRTTNPGEDWRQVAESRITSCFQPLRETAIAALGIESADPYVSYAQQCADNFDEPTVCELE